MRKLMILALGLSFLSATAPVSFAQTTAGTTGKKPVEKAHKGGKKSKKGSGTTTKPSK